MKFDSRGVQLRDGAFGAPTCHMCAHERVMSKHTEVFTGEPVMISGH